MTKVVIIGLDGADFNYMDSWLATGKLPNLAKFVHRGSRGRLQSTFLPLTAMAWPSMLTGKNAGKHGLFDFRFRQSGSYTLTPSSTRAMGGNPLHTHLSQLGYLVGMINVPMTYPPVEVNGLLITDFTTPTEATDWIYPPQLADQLKKAGVSYPIHDLHELMHMKGLHRDDQIKQFIKKWGEFTVAQTNVACHWMQENDFDFFMIVFSSTDHINHFTPDLDSIFEIYEQVDQAVGQIVETLDEDTAIFIVSDHGSAPLHKYIVLNRFLTDLGLIQFRHEVAPHFIKIFTSKFTQKYNQHTANLWQYLPQFARTIISWPFLLWDSRLKYDYQNIDWQHTHAFADSGSGAIYINLKGREPNGIVNPGTEYDNLCTQIILNLKELRDPETNKLVIEDAFLGKEIFHGPYMDLAPDIIFSRQDETYRAITGFANDPVIRSTTRPDGTAVDYGYHTRYGILMTAGAKLKGDVSIKDATIYDIAPTVLHLLGIPIPTSMDGRVLQELFLHDTEIVYTEDSIDSITNTETTLSSTALDDIEERLRSLGYLD